MRRVTFSDVDSTDEIARMFNKVIDNLALVEAKVCEMDRRIDKLSSPPDKKKKKGFIMTRMVLALACFLAIAAACTGATWQINYDNVSNPESLVQLLQDRFSNLDSDWILLDPTDTAPTAVEGKIYYNDTSNALYFYNGSAWTLLASASGHSLDGAYDLGSKIDVDGDVMELEVDDNANNAALLIDMDDSTNNPDCFQITNAGTGDAISINGASTGNLIYDEDGNFTVSSAGVMTFKGGTCSTSDFLFDDTYDVGWDTSEDTFYANDNAKIALGTNFDWVFSCDNTDGNLEAAAANDQFRLGETTNFDFIIHGGTNTNEVTFDTDDSALLCIFDGFDLRMNDDDKIIFGDSSEFVLEYDEDGDDDLVLVAATANDAFQIGDGTTGTDFICVSSGGTAATHAAWFDASGNTNQGIWKFGNDDHGMDVEFYGETASQLVTWDQSADTWYFGDDAEGVDVYFNADTTSDYALWDESDEALELVGAQLHLDDDSALQLGTTAGDVVLQFNGTDFLIDASTADEGLKIGDTTTGFDITYYFETAGTIATDYDGDAMTFSDGMSLVFGTNADASIMYDETTDDNLEIAADSVGMSISTNDFIITTDGAAANQVKFDATGTVAGYAVVVETTDGGVQVNADGAANGDIAIDAADDMTLTAGGDLTLAITGTISAGGSIITNQLVTIETDIDDEVLTAAESSKYFNNNGDANTTVFTLPTAAAGLIFTFTDVEAAAGADLCILANTGDKIDNGTAAQYYNCYDDTYGSSVTLVAMDATEWMVVAERGTWTADSNTTEGD